MCWSEDRGSPERDRELRARLRLGLRIPGHALPLEGVPAVRELDRAFNADLGLWMIDLARPQGPARADAHPPNLGSAPERRHAACYHDPEQIRFQLWESV